MADESGHLKSCFTLQVSCLIFLTCFINLSSAAPPNPYLFFDRHSPSGEWTPKAGQNQEAFFGALQNCCLARQASVLQADGIEYVLAIKIDFSDQPGQRPGAEFDQFLYAANEVSLKTYYREVSYGQMEVQPGPMDGVIPKGNQWYRAKNPMGYYGVGDRHVVRYRELVTEACAAADATVDFSAYDRDGDGVVDHLFIIHAGDDEASTFTGVYGDDIWSVLVPGVNRRFDGVLVRTAILVGEEPSFDKPHLGIYFHEFFHDFGAPDVYGRFIGARDHKWGLMGFDGPYQGNLIDGIGDGLHPSHIIGYLKWDFDARPENGKQGWIEPVEIRENVSNLQIPSFELAPKENKLFKLDIDLPDKVGVSGNSVEFFLIENRYRSSGALFDTHLPESGILIWHIDETKARPIGAVDASAQIWLEDPNDPEHVGIDPNNPDAPPRIQLVTDGAAYSADDGQISFTPATRPNSNAEDGSVSNIAITNIGPEGPTMTLTVSFGDTYEPNDSIATAFPVKPGETYESFLYTPDDRQDFYRFDAVVGTGVVITLSDIPDGVDYRLSLLDAGGQPIADGEKTGVAEQQVAYLPEQIGAIYILVESHFGFSDVDSYLLTINEAQTGSGTLQLAAIRAFPNPFRRGHSAVTFTYTIPEFQLAEEVKLDIFSLAGGLVHTDTRANVIGSNRFRWDGKNADGVVVASGIYLYVISATQGGQTIRKVDRIGVLR